MNIFLSNDDGVNSDGLIKFAERLSKKHNILIVAPDGNRSACSHSLTISDTIKVKEIKNDCSYKAYAISGTPADCVKFAKLNFPNFKADVVIAGINKGHNLGSDILYSGTVSIACEAAFFGNVAFAFSAYNLEEKNFVPYIEYAEKIIDALLPISSKGDIWNVNFPNTDTVIKGIKVTQLGKQIYSDEYIKIDENTYKLVGKCLKHKENEEDCDVEWINKGFITITPILFNKTNYKKIEEVKNKCVKL